MLIRHSICGVVPLQLHIYYHFLSIDLNFYYL